jgi:hypothetical protein
MMWLSLIKSSEGLNRNFSIKSQNLLDSNLDSAYISVFGL